MSTIASHLTLIISETVKDAWFQRTTNRKWYMGYQIVTRPTTSRDRCHVTVVTTSRDPERSNAWPQYA